MIPYVITPNPRTHLRLLRLLHEPQEVVPPEIALADGAEKWRACLDEIRRLPGERSLMLEFVRGDDPAQLIEDAMTLKKWLKGEF